jgi:hypothetical protein
MMHRHLLLYHQTHFQWLNAHREHLQRWRVLSFQYNLTLTDHQLYFRVLKDVDTIVKVQHSTTSEILFSYALAWGCLPLVEPEFAGLGSDQHACAKLEQGRHNTCHAKVSGLPLLLATLVEKKDPRPLAVFFATWIPINAARAVLTSSA